MAHALSRAVLALSAALLGASCASANNQAPSTRQQAAAGDIGPAMLQWAGKFRPGEAATAAAQMHTRNAVTGDVRFTSDGPNVMRAEINFSIDQTPALTGAFRWALYPGECHTASFPLLPINEFPLLAIGNNRGQLDGVVNIPLPTSGRYHVNVFRSNGNDEGDVMGCAEVSLQRRGLAR